MSFLVLAMDYRLKKMVSLLIPEDLPVAFVNKKYSLMNIKNRHLIPSKITVGSPDLRKIKELFINSFPKEQRIPFWLMLLLSKFKKTVFLSFYDKDILCGFTYATTIKNITCITFLAVSPNLRSKGYGKAILNEIHSMYKDNKIVLYIDKCDENALDYEQRMRRKNFYINNGYEETGHLIEIQNVIQEILITNGEFDQEEFAQFIESNVPWFLKKQIKRMVKSIVFRAAE